MALRHSPALGLLFFLLLAVPLAHSKSYEVLYEWKELDYDFNSSDYRQELIELGEFIPANNVITGIKVTKDRIFLTVPRWRYGIPATLVYVHYDRKIAEKPAFPPLIPYPSWEMNELGNCGAIQYVQSMEIDRWGRMWVVDVGRTSIFDEKPDNSCPPKLVLIDLSTDEVIHTYDFPAEVVGRSSSFLNDIVLGCKDKSDCWAYISDAGDAKIIVYSLKDNQAWFVQHGSMEVDEEATEIVIEGESYTFETAVDGIALSPRMNDFSTLYYCPLSSYKLYSIKTAVIKDKLKEPGVQLEDTDVTELGLRPSQADGLTVDAKGILYYGLLGNNSISTWDISETALTDANQVELVQDDTEVQWVDTFAIDENGDGFATTNRLQRFGGNTYNFSEVNFRVIRFHVGEMSYQYLPSGGNTAAEGFAVVACLISSFFSSLFVKFHN